MAWAVALALLAQFIWFAMFADSTDSIATIDDVTWMVVPTFLVFGITGIVIGAGWLGLVVIDAILVTVAMLLSWDQVIYELGYHGAPQSPLQSVLLLLGTAGVTVVPTLLGGLVGIRLREVYDRRHSASPE
jgi:hypothetical protein